MTPSVLIIEDDHILGTILKKKLSDCGYAAELAVDGAIGLETMRQLKPNLVLLDILLPSLNGYEILEAKKDDPEIKDIPVIIISNSGQPVELKRTLELGARDYFIKAQLDPDDIIVKVRTLAPIHGGSAAAFAGKKVLLVEDDTFLSEILSRKLTNEHGVVLHATSGEQALSILDTEMPSIVLLDLILPGMNGFDTLEKIKQHPNGKDTHVVILSNLSQQEDIERAKKLGADTFLVKAISTPSVIFDTVQSILASTQM